MTKFAIDVEEMTEDQAMKILILILNKLDELDEDDYFGTEGWKHFMGFE